MYTSMCTSMYTSMLGLKYLFDVVASSVRREMVLQFVITMGFCDGQWLVIIVPGHKAL